MAMTKQMSKSDIALLFAVLTDYNKTGSSDKKCPHCGTKIIKQDFGSSFSVRCQTPDCFKCDVRGI